MIEGKGELKNTYIHKDKRHVNTTLPLLYFIVELSLFLSHQISSMEEGILHTNIIKALHITFTETNFLL